MKAAASRASRSRGERSGAGRLVVLTRPLWPLPPTTAPARQPDRGPSAAGSVRLARLRLLAVGRGGPRATGAARRRRPERVGFWQPFCLAIAVPTSPDWSFFSAWSPLLLILFSSSAMPLRPSANFAWSFVSSASTFFFRSAYATEEALSSFTASFCVVSPSSTGGAPAESTAAPSAL